METMLSGSVIGMHNGAHIFSLLKGTSMFASRSDSSIKLEDCLIDLKPILMVNFSCSVELFSVSLRLNNA